MTTVAKHALHTFLALSCLMVLPLQSAAQAVGCDTWVMAAGEQYRAGGFHRLTLGAHYRDLWTTPIEVECLDLSTFAGGLMPLRVGGGLLLSWDFSCLSDTDFEVYEGTLGDFASHIPNLCSTGGATSVVLPVPVGDKYYIVVPRNELREGSYGLLSDLSERAPGTFACLTQDIGACPQK